MKIAFLFAGQYRPIPKEVLRHSIENLTKGIDYDIFCYSWDEPGESLDHRENIPKIKSDNDSYKQISSVRCKIIVLNNLKDKDVVKNINVYGEMHRYIPVLAKNEGYHKIGEKIVNHRPRKYGNTKFGPSRFLHGFLDLITIWFISSFGKRPMHLFGSLGLIMLTTGFLFAGFLGYDKIFVNPGGRLITERPEFYISLVTMIIGSQFFSMGFIGELILKSINKSPQYVIQKRTNL